MALLDLTAEEARRLCSVLYGWIGRIDDLKSGDLKAEARLICNAAQALELAQKVEALSFTTRACLVCGATFEAKNPRRTTCSDRCRQALSRSKRAAPAQAPSDGHAPAVTPIPDPVAPPPPAADPAPPSQPDRDGKDPGAELRDFLEEQRERRMPRWELCKADARRHGCTAKQVQRFRLEHRLGFDAPLTPDAAQQLKEQLELHKRVAAGERVAAEKRLMACRRLLTPSVVSAIGALVERLPDLDPHAWKYRWAPVANDYLKSGREGLPDDLWQEIQALAGDGPGFRQVKLRAIAVGCMLRLPDLEQPIPTDPAAFVEWSGLALLVDHRRQANNPAADLADAMAGRMTDERARSLLELPMGTPLTEAAIRGAHRSMARRHHPDRGGDAGRFHQLTEARERLLMTAAVTVTP